MNRDFIIEDGENGITIFGECFHCHEPWIIINQDVSGSLKKSDNSKILCYCRGGNGLSFKITCCEVLNCRVKKGSNCNALPVPKGKIFPIGKWPVIVIDVLPSIEGNGE